MKRRQFMIASALGLATVPAILREAFAQPGASSDPAELKLALERARRTGRPLLIFVIPSDSFDLQRRGHIFGEWLNHGSDAQLAPLALCEVICATAAHLRSVTSKMLSGEPLMALVNPDGSVRSLDAKVPDLPSQAALYTDDKHKEEAIVARRIATVSELVARALPTPKDPAAMAEAVRRKLVKVPPPGSHWARETGCGEEVEGIFDNPALPGCPFVVEARSCGMALVPAKSERFLYFLATNVCTPR